MVPNREALGRYCPDGADQTALAQFARAVQQEIDGCRSSRGGEFPDRWVPSAIALVDEPFSEQNGLVNSTMKIVRSKVEEHFRDRLDYLYTPEGKKPDNERNIASVQALRRG